MNYKSLKQAGLDYGSAKTEDERQKALNNMARIAEQMGKEAGQIYHRHEPTKKDFDLHPAVLRAERMMLKHRFKAFIFSWRGAVLGLVVLGLIIWAWR